MNIKIAPSLLAADYAKLGEEAKKAEDAGADLLHIDVMDGHFVPNITIGAPMVEAIRKCTNLPLDAHLMVKTPENQIKNFLNAGADIITVHLESLAYENARKKNAKGQVIFLGSYKLIDVEKSFQIIDEVHKAGKKIAVAVNPDTPCELLYEIIDKLDMVLIMTVWPGAGAQKFMEEMVSKAMMIRKKKPKLDIQVDGGINQETVGAAASKGANIFVAGTAVFKAPNQREVIQILRQKAQESFSST